MSTRVLKGAVIYGVRSLFPVFRAFFVSFFLAVLFLHLFLAFFGWAGTRMGYCGTRGYELGYLAGWLAGIDRGVWGREIDVNVVRLCFAHESGRVESMMRFGSFACGSIPGFAAHLCLHSTSCSETSRLDLRLSVTLDVLLRIRGLRAHGWCTSVSCFFLSFWVRASFTCATREGGVLLRDETASSVLLPSTPSYLLHLCNA